MAKHRPHHKRVADELRDYAASIAEDISNGYIDHAAQLLGYKSWEDLCRRNTDAACRPLCANKLEKADKLENARQNGDYSGTNYVREIMTLTHAVYNSGMKTKETRQELKEQLRKERFGPLEELLEKPFYERDYGRIAAIFFPTEQELSDYLVHRHESKAMKELLHRSRMANMEGECRSLIDRVKNIHQMHFERIYKERYGQDKYIERVFPETHGAVRS